MTTPQDATEALARVLERMTRELTVTEESWGWWSSRGALSASDRFAAAIAAALAADGGSVVRTEELERLREAAKYVITLSDWSDGYSSAIEELRAALGDPS